MDLLGCVTVSHLEEYCNRRRSGLSSTCMGCLTSSDEVRSIFSMSSKMVEMYQECTDVLVRTDPVFRQPHGLCLGCCRKLIRAKNLRNRHKKAIKDSSMCMCCGIANSIIKIETTEISKIEDCIGKCSADGRGLCLKCNANLIEIHFFITRCQNIDAMLKTFQPVVSLRRAQINPTCKQVEIVIERFDISSKCFLTCHTCNEKFESYTILKAYKAYRCNKCTEISQNEDLLKRLRAKSKFKCNKCKRRLKNYATFTLHQRWHCKFKTKPLSYQEDRKEYECEFCRRVFSYYTTLNRHRLFCREDYLKRVFTCSICKKHFPTLALLQQHEVTPGVHEVFHCGACPYVTDREDRLDKHRLDHTKNLLYKCDTCYQLFRNQAFVNRHKLIYH